MKDSIGKKSLFLSPQISLDFRTDVREVLALAKKKVQNVITPPNDTEYTIFRRSTDARKKERILFVYTVAVRGFFSEAEGNALVKAGFRFQSEAGISLSKGDLTLQHRPVVVGSGPAGLFCALLLAENGYSPVVIERGGSVAEREAAVKTFFEKGILDENSNIQFGAGGAGTFSDGKLMTRISDPCVSYILQRFTEFGAPKEILWQAKPHIGTDILRNVVCAMTDRIEKCGGEVFYHTSLEDVDASGSVIETSRGDIPYGALVLATGHSARDTYRMLMNRGFVFEPKAFSVGVRIEHLQSDVDTSMFGKYAGSPILGHAEYQLSFNTRIRGVYTFCMCPGGRVIAAASEKQALCVNGMSYHARDGKNANSAVAVSVFPDDYGNTPEKAIEFTRSIERAAFSASGSDYSAPVCTVGDFLDGRLGTEPSKVQPTYMNGGRYKLTAPEAYLPEFVCRGLMGGLLDFSSKIKCFGDRQAILCGPETRTSAPVRMLRTEQKTALNHENIYPCGEGAGYAGGITSAAADGIHAAQAIMSKYAPLQ